MEFRIFPELEGVDLLSALESNADSADLQYYDTPLTDTELEERRERFAEVAIEMEEIEARKKEAMDKFKAELAPRVDERHTLLKEIKARAIESQGVLYKFVDYTSRMVGFYNGEGFLIFERIATPEEITEPTINSQRRAK